MNSLFEQIFKETNIAAVYFNHEQKLEVYSQLVCEIWKLPSDAIEKGQNIIEFFEIMRERQVYPEKDDFKVFCSTLINYFTTLPNTLINNLILSNGKNYEESIIPYNKGLLFIWEDTTKLWETTYNLNSYKNLYNRIIERIQLPVIIVASNGLIEGFNLPFSRNFNLPLDFLESYPHVTNLINQLPTLAPSEEIKAYLIGLFLSRKDFIHKLPFNNNDLEINGFPLPNGNNFILFKSSIDSISTANLNIPNTLNNLKELQNNMVLDLEKVLNIPLNTIIGFADMLKQNYLGALNHKQEAYISKIIQEAEFIRSELENKIELTVYESHNQVTLTNIDINEVLVAVMQQIKTAAAAKGVKINLNISPKSNFIMTNFKLLTKLLVLTLLYIINQNNHNSVIEIEIKNPPLWFTIKDSSKKPLFTGYELNNRYDLALILRSIELLKGSYQILTQNRSFRTLIYKFN